MKSTALKLLEDLHFQKAKENYPNVPESALPRKRFKDNTTNALTQAVLTWLQLNGHYAVRVSSSGRYVGGKSFTDVIGRVRNLPGRFIPGTTRSGTADVHASISGVHCSLEIKCKATKDRMSEVQKRTAEDVQRSGGIYFIVPDFETFLRFYHNLTQ